MSLGDGEWVDASFALPMDCHLPVIVKLANGKQETRRKIEGSWVAVVAWMKCPPKPE